MTMTAGEIIEILKAHPPETVVFVKMPDELEYEDYEEIISTGEDTDDDGETIALINLE